jgi:hypothetical protein
MVRPAIVSEHLAELPRYGEDSLDLHWLRRLQTGGAKGKDADIARAPVAAPGISIVLSDMTHGQVGSRFVHFCERHIFARSDWSGRSIALRQECRMALRRLHLTRIKCATLSK